MPSPWFLSLPGPALEGNGCNPLLREGHHAKAKNSGSHAALRHKSWAASFMRRPSAICCLCLFGTLFDCLGHLSNRHERAGNLVEQHVSILFLRQRLGE